MDIRRFVQWWQHRERDELVAMIDLLDAVDQTTDGHICRLRAEAQLEACLRRSECSRQACTAAHHATCAVLEVCEQNGLLDENRTGVTRLARAAGEIGRGLVAAPDADFVAELLRPLQPALDSAARSVH